MDKQTKPIKPLSERHKEAIANGQRKRWARRTFCPTCGAVIKDKKQ